jgi:hypothetical protein
VLVLVLVLVGRVPGVLRQRPLLLVSLVMLALVVVEVRLIDG